MSGVVGAPEKYGASTIEPEEGWSKIVVAICGALELLCACRTPAFADAKDRHATSTRANVTATRLLMRLGRKQFAPCVVHRDAHFCQLIARRDRIQTLSRNKGMTVVWGRPGIAYYSSSDCRLGLAIAALVGPTPTLCGSGSAQFGRVTIWNFTKKSASESMRVVRDWI